MTDLKIRDFKGDKVEPETTITIPGHILREALNIIPKQVTAALQDKGIDLNELIRLSMNPEVKGTLVVIEEHRKNKKIEISIE